MPQGVALAAVRSVAEERESVQVVVEQAGRSTQDATLSAALSVVVQEPGFLLEQQEQRAQ
jgi:hypothetical protein